MSTLELEHHNPLQWPALQKLAVLSVSGLWILLGTSNMTIIAPALEMISEEFQAPITKSAYLIGSPLLAYGVTSLVWVPLGNRFGVRAVYFCSSFAAACFSIWAARASSFASLMAARTLASAMFAPPETLAPAMVGDVFCPGSRAKAMSFITILQAIGFAGAPIVGSGIVVDDTLGWRWIEWIMAFVAFGTCGLIFMFYPETQYSKVLAVHGSPRFWQDNLRFWPASGSRTAKYPSLAAAFTKIFPFFIDPIVILSTAFISACLLLNAFVATSQSLAYLILYDFSPLSAGLTYVASVLGAATSMLTTGTLADALFSRATRQQGASPPPQHRLRLLILSCMMGVAGALLYGICIDDKCFWIAPLVGSFFVNFFFVSSLSVTFAYLLDLYGDKTDNVMIIVNGFKNFAAFGVSFAIVPWTTRSGYAIPLGVLAAIVVVGHLLMVLCYCFTRRLSTKNGFGQSMNYDGGLNEEIVREGVPTELKESASYLESC